MKTLTGRVALITGASAGIGLEISRALAREGMQVCLAARSREPLERAAEEIRASGGAALAIPTDVTDLGQLKHLVEQVVKECGTIDVLINNAGIETFCNYHESSLDEIEQTIQVNLTAALLLTRLVLPHMLSTARGHIVNLSSTAGKHGPAFGAAYGASKAGLIAFTQSLRSEYHGRGISASVICPGFTDEGGMYEQMKSDTGKQINWLVGSTTAAKVAEKVVQAIRTDAPEKIVNSSPVRTVFTLTQAAPRLGGWVARRTTISFLTSLAQARSARRASGDPSS